MSNKTALSHDDAVTVNVMIDDLIIRFPTADKRDLQRHLIDELHDMATSGDVWADAAIVALAEDGCGGRISARLKADRGVVRIAHTGAVISLPTRFGVPAVGDDGQRERHYQQPLWWELSWDRFSQLVNSLIRQSNRIGEEIAALQEIQRLRERFPESKNVGEACEMAGIDPRSFGVEASRMIASDALRTIADVIDTAALSDADVERIAARLDARQAARLAELLPVFDMWLTPELTCEVMQVSRDTLATLERDGLLTPSRVGTRIVRYARRDIAALMDAHKVGVA